MKHSVVHLRLFIAFAVIALNSFASPNNAAEIDWRAVGKLQDQALLSYVDGLELRGQAALDFWKKIPVSRANREIHRLFRREAFAIYMNKYPRSHDRFDFGHGTGPAEHHYA